MNFIQDNSTYVQKSVKTGKRCFPRLKNDFGFFSPHAFHGYLTLILNLFPRPASFGCSSIVRGFPFSGRRYTSLSPFGRVLVLTPGFEVSSTFPGTSLKSFSARAAPPSLLHS